MCLALHFCSHHSRPYTEINEKRCLRSCAAGNESLYVVVGCCIVVAGVITSLFTVLDRFTISSPTLCSVTTLAPSIIPSRQNNASRESSTTSSIIAISGVATAAALGAALTAIDAADLQMLVSVLGSPCVCSTTATTQRSVLLLALSPFSPLGSAWAAIENSLLCYVVVFVHLLAVYIVTSYSATTQVIQQPTPSSNGISLNTLLGRWLRKDETRSSRGRRKVLSRLRFPNISVTLLMLLVPGVVRACVAASNSLHNSSNDNDVGESLALSAVAIAVGVVFTFLACAFVELIAYRHANAEVISRNLRVYEDPHAQYFLNFVHHQHQMRLFKPIPRPIALVALPRGAWEPQAARTAYGGVISSYLARWRRAWVVVPGANIVVQLLNGVGGDDTTCDALQAVTLLVLACVCAFIAYARPHRALLASYLVCASLVLMMVTALLGLLCRHGAVGPDAVSVFGVFASVAMFVFKLYHVLMPIVERRLMGRNGIIDVKCTSLSLEGQTTRIEATNINFSSDQNRQW